MNNNRILILSGGYDPYGLGGITLLYNSLFKYFPKAVERYYSQTSRKSNPIKFLWNRLIGNSLQLRRKLIECKPDLVVLNTSLKAGFYSIIPELIICRHYAKKIVLFNHGWDINSEYMLSSFLGKFILKRADAMFVLSCSFKQKLNKLPHAPKSVYVLTTTVDDELLDGFDISVRNGKIKNFLFLARMEKYKGIIETIDTFNLLQRKHPDIQLRMVGSGSGLEEAKQHVIEKNIRNVTFPGLLKGEDVTNEYKNADFFFLLSYSEGMPSSVLEAMSFGLPVATRPVGGVPDIFQDGINGVLSDSLDPQFYASRIEKLMDDEQTTYNMQIGNYQYGQNNFKASKVSAKMMYIFDEIINNNNK